MTADEGQNWTVQSLNGDNSADFIEQAAVQWTPNRAVAVVVFSTVPNAGSTFFAYASYSEDDGATFAANTTLFSTTSNSIHVWEIARSQGGVLFAHNTNNGTANLFARSTDGVNWTTFDSHISTGCSCDNNAIAFDDADGSLYVLYQDGAFPWDPPRLFQVPNAGTVTPAQWLSTAVELSGIPSDLTNVDPANGPQNQGHMVILGDASLSGAAIDSSGPINHIEISPQLNCSANHIDDIAGEFGDDWACATLVAVDGVLYGPGVIPGGSAAGPRTAFTSVSQVGPTGSGTTADPFEIVTVVDAGSSGIRVTQTDSYVVGTEVWQTDVEVDNSSGSSSSVELYRAFDCNLNDSDSGYGRISTDSGSAACQSNSALPSPLLQILPMTVGSNYYEASADEVWTNVGSQQPFDDTCRCGELIDNAAGLSWSLNVPASSSITNSSRIVIGVSAEDGDDDGLPDEYERGGVLREGEFVDLPAMLADPQKPDLYVHLDFVSGQKLSDAAIQLAVDAFANSPYVSPTGSIGINLHVDQGDASILDYSTGATWSSLSRAGLVTANNPLGTGSPGNYDWTDFDLIKNAQFPESRKPLFHYAISVVRYGTTTSTGIGRAGGSDFIISLADRIGNDVAEAGTLMHELGHNLTLEHGGIVDVNFKPNYLSVMNYAFQLDGVLLNGVPVVDYSSSMLPDLDEEHLDEPDGLSLAAAGYGTRFWCADLSRYIRVIDAAAPIDWNCDGDATDTNIAVDINNDPEATNPPELLTLFWHDDWSLIDLVRGSIGDLAGTFVPPAITPDNELTEELAALIQPWTTITEIGAGYSHSLAVDSGSNVWAWGSNDFGQIGDGSNTDRHSPIQVSNLTDVAEVEGGFWHSLAIENDGTVSSWGRNDRGQLGNGTKTDSNTVVEVSSLTNVVQIEGGNRHSMALKDDGTVWTWGGDHSGQLGDGGAKKDKTTPVPVSSLSGVTAIAAGGSHSLALLNDGTVWAWGEGGLGQLGNGSTQNKSTPVQVENLTNVVAIGAGDDSSYAVKSDGTTWAWGEGLAGQLGDGTETNTSTPVQVANISAGTEMLGGAWHALILVQDGSIWATGQNNEGALGNGTTTHSSVPVQSLLTVGAIDIASGLQHGVALLADGSMWVWGWNCCGQLGNGTAGSFAGSTVPIEVILP